MMKKLIIALLIIVAGSTVVFAASENSGQKNLSNPNINNITNQTNQEISSNTTTSDTSTQISPPEAKKNAQKYIEEPKASTGTPENVDIAGHNVYVVPVQQEGKTVGEIDIDPKTGKNVGGAGGAPAP